MSDIVERLRTADIYDHADADKICNEAADEIEKLRAENEHLATSNHAYLSGYQEAIAEIEKLREALREIRNKARTGRPPFMSSKTDFFQIASKALGEKE
jgi:hypothetical protein